MTSRNSPPVVDMSPAAVAHRLDTVQSLYELMVEFRGARIVGSVADRPISSPLVKSRG